MGFAAADGTGIEKFRRFSGTGHFDPSFMSAASAPGLLRALAAESAAPPAVVGLPEFAAPSAGRRREGIPARTS